MDTLYQPYKALTAGQRKLKCCIESKTVETGNRFISSRDADILVPLASDARFLPLKREAHIIQLVHIVPRSLFSKTIDNSP